MVAMCADGVWWRHHVRDSLHGKPGRYIKKDPVSGLPGLQALE